MDEQQQADLATAMATLETPAAEPAPTEPVPSEAPPAAPEATPAAEAAPTPPAEQTPAESYQNKLQRIMDEQRGKAQEQMAAKQPDSADALRRIEEAKAYGPEAVLRAAGIEPEKRPTLAEILGKDDASDEPEYVQELRAQLATNNEKMSAWEKSQEEQQQQQQQQQRYAWEQSEQAQIAAFIDTEAETFPYVSALKPMNSDADLYNGMISMYNNGYQPTYKDMADLVETRIEGVLDHLAESPKFSEWVQKKFGVKVAVPSAAPTQTMTGKDGAESPASVDPNTLTEEESIALAMKAAQDAAAAAKAR